MKSRGISIDKNQTVCTYIKYDYGRQPNSWFPLINWRWTTWRMLNHNIIIMIVTNYEIIRSKVKEFIPKPRSDIISDPAGTNSKH